MAVTTPRSRSRPRPDHAASTNDIALRDFGLMLGALTLARLAAVYDAPRRQR